MSDTPLPADELLPTWSSCCEKDETRQPMSALERFIYDNEPAGQRGSEFRRQLAAVIQEAKS